MGYPITRKKTHPGKIPILKNPGNKNLQIFKNPQSGLGIFGDSKSPTLIPRISNPRGFFGLAQNKNPHPFWEFPKNPIPKPPLVKVKNDESFGLIRRCWQNFG